MKTPAFRAAATALAERNERVCIMCARAGCAREHAANPQEDLWQED
jgi:hypothetical protein